MGRQPTWTLLTRMPSFVIVATSLACHSAALLAGGTPAGAGRLTRPSGAVTFVSDAEEIRTAMQTAQPGDTLVMRNATWREVGQITLL